MRSPLVLPLILLVALVPRHGRGWYAAPKHAPDQAAREEARQRTALIRAAQRLAAASGDIGDAPGHTVVLDEHSPAVGMQTIHRVRRKDEHQIRWNSLLQIRQVSGGAADPSIARFRTGLLRVTAYTRTMCCLVSVCHHRAATTHARTNRRPSRSWTRRSQGRCTTTLSMARPR